MMLVLVLKGEGVLFRVIPVCRWCPCRVCNRIIQDNRAPIWRPWVGLMLPWQSYVTGVWAHSSTSTADWQCVSRPHLRPSSIKIMAPVKSGVFNSASSNALRKFATRSPACFEMKSRAINDEKIYACFGGHSTCHGGLTASRRTHLKTTYDWLNH